jgi:dihydropteroate synthase
MGILNVTPDSFSDGGTYQRTEDACRRAFEMAEEGADIIDIGGESTRPGSRSVDPEEELSRIVPVIDAIADRIPAPISVDTRRAAVARKALDTGCRIVNDITACRDPEMPAVVREYGAPIVLMHMKGTPESMQTNPGYGDVVAEVSAFLRERVEFVKRCGVEDDMIIVDPGIGFGKRFRDNLDLLHSIDSLRAVGYPVTVGASRKRFLGELLKAEPDGRLSGNLATAAWCYTKNVDIVRVHDVKETMGLFRVLDAIGRPEDYSASW